MESMCKMLSTESNSNMCVFEGRELDNK